MDFFNSDQGQYDPKGESNIARNHQRELINNCEKGDPSVFEEILVNELEQLQEKYQTIAAQEGSFEGFTNEVMKALFAGIQAKITGRNFANWVAGTAAEVAIEYLRGAHTS